MTRQRLSHCALAVLHALAHGETHGFDIIDRTGFGSSSVYPTLGKLEDAGLVSARWEPAGVARADKRPPRRYYELRPAGRKALDAELAHYRALQQLPRATARAKGRG
jgi:PadR family transcriptional regulator, regulatory protein PadR